MSAVKRKATELAAIEAKRPKANAAITSFFAAPKPATSPSGTTAANQLTDSLIAGEEKSLANTSSVNGNGTGTTLSSSPVAPSSPSTPAAPTSLSAPFDKQAWIDSLSSEHKTLLQLEIDTLDESWLAALRSDLTTPRFLSLKRFLAAEKQRGTTVFPPAADIYSWSRHTPLDRVRAVILGQDPYHNNNQAHGLCFSVRPPTPAPPSLKNIYTALRKDYPSFTPPTKNGGLLTPWADSGVLMLNTCLTVEAHKANSHANKGWEEFTQRVIDIVCKRHSGPSGKGIVFLAWGSPAQKRLARVSATRHLVLKSVHPSPLSASKGFVSLVDGRD